MKILLFDKGEKREMQTGKGMRPIAESIKAYEKLFFTLHYEKNIFTFIGWTKLPDDITSTEEGKCLIVSSTNRDKLEILKNKILQLCGYQPQDWIEIENSNYRIWDNRRNLYSKRKKLK